MYTPSVYSGLVSLLISSSPEQLTGKRIGVFSYGSGLASSMYSLTVSNNMSALKQLMDPLSYVLPLLESREKVAPKDFAHMMEIREKNNHAAPFEPSGNIGLLFPGTYYLKSIDELHRRTYERTPTISNGVH